MTLVKWRRQDENLPVFSNYFDSFFRDFDSDFLRNSNLTKVPSANIIETSDDFRIELAVPGINKKDIKINLEKRYLTIEGGDETKTEDSNERFTRKEFNYNSFKRSFRLPHTVDSEKISAKYNDGILNVIIPKKEEEKEKPALQIKVS